MAKKSKMTKEERAEAERNAMNDILNRMEDREETFEQAAEAIDGFTPLTLREILALRGKSCI